MADDRPLLVLRASPHDFPEGDDSLGPVASLAGRDIGQDFSGRYGWSMYHGKTVPGFPQHPHRGFETITYVRQGLIDHADSLGATARFGRGDTQWMTAGSGVQHCEMFPLINSDGPNPLELFQIWLNLPAADKMVDPYFTMLWSHRTPTHIAKDDDGRTTEITIITGRLADETPADTPPDSWAAKDEADVAIWHIRLEPDATWILPAARGEHTQRMLYAFEGSSVSLDDMPAIDAGTGARIRADVDISLRAGAGGIDCMLLQGRPIGEPIARYGPFVMNTEEEIHQTYRDYQATQFGGWPWPSPEPNHGATQGRFAIHADGRREDIND